MKILIFRLQPGNWWGTASSSRREDERGKKITFFYVWARIYGKFSLSEGSLGVWCPKKGKFWGKFPDLLDVGIPAKVTELLRLGKSFWDPQVQPNHVPKVPHSRFSGEMLSGIDSTRSKEYSLAFVMGKTCLINNQLLLIINYIYHLLFIILF